MPDYQVLFNIVVGILGVMGGWLLNTMWSSLRDLQTADAKLVEKVSAIEVLVAGQYVTRDEFTTTMNAVFLKLDRIQETINKKADR
jgi:CHASE3 domain sensor protein